MPKLHLYARTAALLVMVATLVLVIASCEAENGAESSALPSPVIAIETTQADLITETPEPLALPYPQNQFTTASFTPYFLNEPEDMDTTSKIMYYGEANTKLNVQKIKGEFVQIDSQEIGTIWIPVWYGTDAAQNIQITSPARLTLNPNAELSLFPDSINRKKDLNEQTAFYAVLQWEDWYGVLLPPQPGYEDNKVLRPLLLWVNERDISKLEEIKTGILQEGSTVPLVEMNQIIEAVFYKGIDQSIVEQLLGKPHFIEASKNLDQGSGPIRLGITWRYEHKDGQALITFTEDGKLTEWKLILPVTDSGHTQISRYQYPEYQAFDFRVFPLAPTIKPNWTWRNQHWLSYNYLYGALDHILLIKGDDGYFSGMHDNSDLYALDRLTGKMLWQVKAGHSGFAAFLDSSRNQITVSTPYNPDIKKYVQLVQHIRLSDGKVIWKREFPEDHSFMMLARAKDAVLLYNRPSDQLEKGELLVWDVKTGKQKWSRSFEGAFQIHNQSENDPYILLQYENTLQALQPNTGKVQWSINVNGVWDGPIQYSAGLFTERKKPFNADLSERWLLLGSEQILLNVKTSHVISRYQVRSNELVSPVDKRFLLIQKTEHGSIRTDDSIFETEFFDTQSGKMLWSLPGKATKAVIEDEVLYVIVDGIPSAINKMDGRILWQLQTNGFSKMLTNSEVGSFTIKEKYLLLPYEGDLLVIRKDNGQIMNRIQDVMFGYPELGDADTWNGYMNIDGNDLYVGSSNGYFSKFQLPVELE
ncbi:outer membrane protein assembly factor BamB [Paenibacillus castaneae]|uniref:outer membrane protein assembly factor BamB family protein n=1 Tax=Paenibacillus castaneae TaxID=474957 RepID=UPI000C998997|nr:PQQ-binding-like beta-propeller repeat protein [Paenibacillus castaneae]NIK75435.1 outer membrane protein assembly factor BamB [Paenibacillus castaneae]